MMRAMRQLVTASKMNWDQIKVPLGRGQTKHSKTEQNRTKQNKTNTNGTKQNKHKNKREEWRMVEG